MTKKSACWVLALGALLCYLPSAQAGSGSRLGTPCMGPEQKVISQGNGALWRVSFEDFAANHPDLSPAKQALINDALSLTPTITAFEAKRSAPSDLVRREVEIVSRA